MFKYRAILLFLFCVATCQAAPADSAMVAPDTITLAAPQLPPLTEVSPPLADSLRQVMQLVHKLTDETKSQVRVQLIMLLVFIIVLTILLLANINYRKKRDERMQQLEKLLTNEHKEKSKIYNIIAGELREPLNELYRAATMLRDGNALQALQSTQLLANYRDTFNRSELLLLNLFTWTTLRSRKPEELNRNKKTLNLRQQFEGIKQKAAFPYREKNIHVINDIDSLINVKADDATLSLIIWNLLDNAIKFSPDGAPVRVSAREKNRKLEICIRDNGTGMSPEFTYDFELSSYDEYTSEGLGLQVCKLLVATQQGDIWFESEQGAGTSAYFTIPA